MDISNATQVQFGQSDRISQVRQAAENLEASFLTEMLKSAGLGEAGGAFGGGAGEGQFSSILLRAQAEQISQAGGIGLADMFFNALMENANDSEI